MSRRVRWIALFTLAALSLTLLSGCHGSQARKSFAVPEAFDEERQHEITFWAKNDTNKTQTMIYKQAIESFQSLYPNVTVALRLYTDYSRIYNDVITNIATGTTPNVCVTYPDHIATYLTGSEIVVPLDELFNHPQYGLGGSEVRFEAPTSAEMIPGFLEECAIGGRHYAVPFMRSTEACYINRTYVEKLGYTLPDELTWDFIWEVSEAAMARDEEGNYLINGQKTMIPFIYKSTDNMMIQMLRQKGAGYSSEQGEILLFNDTAAQLLDTIAGHAKNGAFSTFKISSYPANFLNAGQCIFAIDSTAGATWMGTDAPLCDISEDALVEFETVVMPIPQFDPAHPQMISQGPSVCVFNKEDSQEVLASWLFVQYLLSNEVQIAYAQTEGYVPVTQKAQQDPRYQDYLSRGGEDDELYYDIKIQASRLLLDNIDHTFVTPVFNGSASLRDAAGQMIESVVKSIRRKETVDAAYIQKLYADVSSLYRLDQLAAETKPDGEAREDLGPLPAASVALLAALAAAWILMGIYVLREARKKKEHAK